VTSFSTESYYDYLTVNNQQFSGSGTGLAGEYVLSGEAISWHSDSSVTRSGFAVCGAVVAPPPPGAVFRVVSSSTNSANSDACTVSSSGRCFSDGLGSHDNNERCVIEVLQSASLSVIEFNTESGYDHLTVNNQRYSGTNTGLSGTAVAAGSQILWSSDYSVTNGGFEICA
jgi:hypothetical protein